MQGGYLERKQKRRPNLDSSSSNGVLDMLASAALNATAAAGPGYTAMSGLYSSSGNLDAGTYTSDVNGLFDGGGFGNFSDVIHTNLDLLTLSNVYPGSRRMWVHLASVYIITLVALKVRECTV
jgi:hypothetical protein